MFSDWALRTLFYVFRSSSELVSKFKNSVLVQKSIKSAIQRHLFFFSSEIEQERDPKTFFFQIELWVDIHFFFKSSSELVSKFKNSIRLWNRSRARSKDFKFFSDRALSLVFRSIKSAIQRHYFFSVQKSIKSAIQRHLFFFSSEIEQERDPKTFNFFQIELMGRYPLFSDRALSWFLDSTILF